MKIKEIEITNLRSIREKVVVNNTKNNLYVFVGANSTGKSNILRAINIFFNGVIEEGRLYDHSKDSYINSSTNTKISIELDFSDIKDKWMRKHLDQHYKKQFDNYIIPITLSISPSNVFTYSIQFSGGQRKSDPALIEVIKNYVNCVYIPSIKDYRRIIYSGLMKKIVAASFHGWGKGIDQSRKISEQRVKFSDLAQSLQKILDESGDLATASLKSIWEKLDKFKFSLPYDNIEEFLGSLNFKIKETQLADEIELDAVGSGVQAYAILSILKLVHDLRQKSTYKKTAFLWLIEEPETFMHHDFQRKTREKLVEFAQFGNIFISTHSPVFISKSLYDSCYVVENIGHTSIKKIHPIDIMKIISGHLGVRLSDFIDIGRYNLLVEGESDKNILEAALKKYKKTRLYPYDEDIKFISCGSANGIEHYYSMYSSFIEYASFNALFDRDDAGKTSRNRLIAKGFDNRKLLLVPEVLSNRLNTCIEDIMDNKRWNEMIRMLDQQNVITVKSKGGKITGYEFAESERIKFKKISSKHIIASVNKSKTGYEKYISLIETIIGSFESANCS